MQLKRQPTAGVLKTGLVAQKTPLYLPTSMLPRIVVVAILPFICLHCLLAGAQIPSSYNFKFKNYTTQNGLVHNFTRKCCMDSKGFLWIITQNGLSRFDGFTFKNYRKILGDTTSLPYNDLWDIAIDDDDKVWLAYGNGMCYYDQKKQSFFTIHSTLNTNAVSLVYDQKSRTVWYNTYKGLFKVNTNTVRVEATLQQVDYPQKPYTTCINSKGQIFTGIERLGYYIYNTANNSFTHYDHNCWPRHFYEDEQGKMWMGTWGFGLRPLDGKYTPAVDDFYDIQHPGIPEGAIYQGTTQSRQLTGNNILWVLTHTTGVLLFDKQQKKFIKWIKYNAAEKTGPLSNFNSTIYTDKQGIIWICSWRGLSKINKQEQQFQSAEIPALESNNYNLFSGIADDPVDNNMCWITAEGSGLAKYDKQNEKIVRWFYHQSPNAYKDIYDDWRWTKAIYKDDKKRLWVPCDGGVIKIENGMPDTISMRWKGRPVISPAGKLAWQKNIFWMFTREGVIRVNTDSYAYKFYRNQPPNETKKLLRNLFYDGVFIDSVELLCTTKEGVYILNTTTGTFTRLLVPSETLDKANQFFVAQKINDKVYIGGETGLWEYNTALKKFTLKGFEQEIFKVEFSALKKDALDKLWIYTSTGFFRYDPVQDQFKKFTTLDGIYDNSSDPVQMFDYNNNIYIGYRMAYTRFNPLQVDINNSKVTPIITDLTINNRAGKIYPDSFSHATLNLGYQQNDIAFEFTGIDYTGSEHITFAHMLEGFDKDWVQDGTRRSATYSNLQDGNYIFKVKALNSSGIANKEIATLYFYIKPPFWQTWWFKTLVTVLFMGGVFSFAFYRIRKTVVKEAEKTAVNKMVAELEMKALRSQMNPHFIFNSLNSIQKYIWENKQDDASEYLAKFSALMRIILNNSMKKLVTLEEEMISLQLYLELEHRRCNNKFDYTVNINNITIDNILVPPMLMQPYIENAIWHGLLQKQGRGSLVIVMHYQSPKTLICTIEDDGIGRKKAEEIKKRKDGNTTSYGMQITQQRLSIAEVEGRIGKVIVEDLYDSESIPTGTKITLHIPVETFEKIG